MCVCVCVWVGGGDWDVGGFSAVSQRSFLKDVPAEQIRIHVCWGNYAGPHHKDLTTLQPKIREIVPTHSRYRVSGVSGFGLGAADLEPGFFSGSQPQP